jgi:hypothetical protein
MCGLYETICNVASCKQTNCAKLCIYYLIFQAVLRYKP